MNDIVWIMYFLDSLLLIRFYIEVWKVKYSVQNNDIMEHDYFIVDTRVFTIFY